MQELTERQSEIYNFIAKYQNANGYSPSRQDIASGIGIHASTLRGHLHAMDKKNILIWNENIPRSITLIKQPV
ncbi:MAG: hypothetical protein FWD87_05070 [Spirochaetaceae bacterium]|nr:hypothetical protein [Spirochaetaceae bacterium]